MNISNSTTIAGTIIRRTKPNSSWRRLFRLTIIPLIRISIPVARYTIIPLARALSALLQWLFLLLATSRVPELLGIKPKDRECTAPGACVVCLFGFLLLGFIFVDGVHTFVSNLWRLPPSLRGPKAYAASFMLSVFNPALLLAMLWWACQGWP